jgi:hypothetical protein
MNPTQLDLLTTDEILEHLSKRFDSMLFAGCKAMRKDTPDEDGTAVVYGNNGDLAVMTGVVANLIKERKDDKG